MSRGSTFVYVLSAVQPKEQDHCPDDGKVDPKKKKLNFFFPFPKPSYHEFKSYFVLTWMLPDPGSDAEISRVFLGGILWSGMVGSVRRKEIPP
jgi:hypothetical protein